MYTGSTNFFNLNNQKSHIYYIIKIDQSQMPSGKVATKSKMPLMAKKPLLFINSPKLIKRKMLKMRLCQCVLGFP